MPFSNFFKRGKAKAKVPPIGEPVAVSPWQAQNQETLDELARFVDFAEGFTLGFLEINFEKDLEEVLKALRKRPECATVQFHTFTLDDPNLRFLKDTLEAKIRPLSLLKPKKRIILVKGLENAVGLFGDYPPLLQDLNFVRDAWLESVPYPVLFCLPSYAINRLIQFSPDFWSWKSGVFRIAVSQERSDEASIYALHARQMIGNASQLEREERIKLLEKLAQEFDPLQANRSKADLRVAAEALTELGIVQRWAGELLKAEAALTLAAQVFAKPEWQPETKQDLTLRIKYLTWHGELAAQLGQRTVAEERFQSALLLNNGVEAGLKALAYDYLGQQKAQQGKVDAAISLFQQSLDIRERIGDVQGKAFTLHNIGQLKVQQGEGEVAIALFLQSLDIKERIGDVQGKAPTLRKLGGINQQKGELAKAEILFQESLQIEEELGSVKGIAESLDWIAGLKAQQGEVEAAIALCQQSLDIKERIGDAQGKAANLHQMAMLKANQGEVEAAIALSQQSLEIAERIGDARGKAANLAMLGQLLADKQGDFATAIPYLAESLAIFQRIGSPDAATVAAILTRITQDASQGTGS